MKKYLISFIVIAALLAVSTTLTYAAKGDPFKEIWDAITGLQQQLNNAVAGLQAQITSIQLLPGPTGSPGPQGEQGPAGPSGTNVIILDSQDNEVGVYAGTVNELTHDVWNRDLSLVLRVDMRLMKINNENVSASTLYEALNCEGNPIGQHAYPYMLYKIEAGNKYGWTYVKTKDGFNPRVNIQINSRWEQNTQTCLNSAMQVDGTEIQPITIPIFFPPFRIVEL